MRPLFITLLLAGFSGFGQSLSSLNLNYWYDPNTEIEFVMTPVNAGNKFKLYYQLISNRKENAIETYSIEWEFRDNLNDKNGHLVMAVDSTIIKADGIWKGMLTLPPPPMLGYVLAKVTNTSTQEVFNFYKPIDPAWPINTIVNMGGYPLLKTYLPTFSTISFQVPEKKHNGFFYKTNFSAARPPYAELVSTDPFLKADSTFTASNLFIPKSKGLYLFQDDTTSAKGFSFIVTDNSYPKYNRISALTGPLVYICTDDEYKQLLAAQTDKAAFDKVILEITRDKERARNLMRSYFQRVEAANRYFTDYKDGWKTDRGMVYIIYGLPEEVSRTADKEIWNYTTHKTKFVFTKTGSIFYPESYKMQRDNQYMVKWFALIDLWRKSRF